MWFRGLLDLRRKAGIKAVYDLSATPYYLKGSGYNEGFIFPWVVSDFSLMDAIESGIVKVPRIPVDDDAASERVVYLNLWDNIQPPLPKRRTAKAVDPTQDWVPPQTLEGAMRSLYRSYERNHERHERELAKDGEPPPVMIIVCPNTMVSKLVFDWIAGREKELPNGQPILVPGKLALLSNVEDGVWLRRQRTILVDSVQLESGDPLGSEFKKDAAHEIAAFKQAYRLRNPGADVEKLSDADLLREVMNTIGKRGKLGEHIRCVVSVGMLTEGWDANTVTHILGIRAFRSQLLCEQVVGRGLRRRSYAVEPTTGRFEAEYAEVYGVPFAVHPDRPTAPDGARPKTAGRGARRARPARPADRLSQAGRLSRRAARRAGVRDVRRRLAGASRPGRGGAVGEGRRGHRAGCGDGSRADPQRAATAGRLCAREDPVRAELCGDGRRRTPMALPAARGHLETVAGSVRDGRTGRQHGNLLLAQPGAEATERIANAIVSYPGTRDPIVMPIIRPFDERGSTDDVYFLTRKVVMDPPPRKSHLNHVVLDGIRGNSLGGGVGATPGGGRPGARVREERAARLLDPLRPPGAEPRVCP